MHRRHWREIVEIVGVISIVAALLLLTREVRHSNRIASAEIGLQLQQGYSRLHLNRATNSEFAKLFPKLIAPEAHLVTATDDSQIEGLARHYTNLFWSTQLAYENGLLSRQELEAYIHDVDYIVDRYPGMRRHLIRMYNSVPAFRDKEVFRPIADLAADQALYNE